MDNENPTYNQSDEAPNSSPETPSPDPLKAPETYKPATKSKLQEVKNELTVYERSTPKWTPIIVFINFITCLFVGLQFYEMKSASTDTHELAVAAKNTAEATKQQVEKSGEQVAALQAQVQAITKQMILDQRPWIGIIGVKTDNPSETHDLFSADAVWVSIQNSGKTPALNVSIQTMYGGAGANLSWREPFPDFDLISSRLIAERKKRERERDERYLAHFPPKMRDRMKAQVRDWRRLTAEEAKKFALAPEHAVMAPNTTQQLKLVQNGWTWPRRDQKREALRNYILGKITYTDTFDPKKIHATTICLWHDSGMLFAVCPNGKMD